MKILLGVVAGAVVAFLCVFGVETAGHMVFPPPAGTDLTDPAQVARLMEIVPAGALAFVAVAWFVGALAGAWVANAVAKRALAGWIALPLIAAWLAQRFAKVAV